jgi:hypothetical protein
MKGPIYIRYRFEDGDEHRMLYRDALAAEHRQLLALAKATGNHDPLNRWLEQRAQKDFQEAATKQAKREYQAAAVRGKQAKAREKAERIRAIAATSPDLQGDELVCNIQVRWDEVRTDAKEKIPSARTIYRALNRQD